MLEILDVNKTFNGKSVLKNINLLVENGRTHGLIGSSGSGKTTLLRATLGLISLDHGKVRINHHELLSISREDWADQIGYVPQEGGLFPHLTGKQNVSLVASLRGWDQSKINSRLKYLSGIVDLDPLLLTRFPNEMSGGQKQRIAIMRAAFMNPALILLDEPMGALDPLIRMSLQQELKAIFKELKKTVVIVTHDLSEAVFFAEKLTLLHEGRVIQTGTYQELVNHPADPFVSLFISAYRILPHQESEK